MSDYVRLEKEDVEKMTDAELVEAHKEWVSNWRYESAAEGSQYSHFDTRLCGKNCDIVKDELDKRCIYRFEGSVKYGCTYCLSSKYFKMVDKELVEVKV